MKTINWISVKDKLPGENPYQILVWIAKQGKCVKGEMCQYFGVLEWDGKDFVYEDGTPFWKRDCNLMAITHWAEIIPPYIKE